MTRILNPRERARELRKAQTPAEEALWALVRHRQVFGLKFRRQQPVSRYIADFCCPGLRLIVELDGEIHESETQAAHDQTRDHYLQALCYEVLRFPNDIVLSDPDAVIAEIKKAALALRPSLAHKLKLFSPSSGDGGRPKAGGAGEGAGG